MQWKIDPSHSDIGFGVRHLGISTVRGRFQKFGGTVETDDAGRPRAIDVTIEAASIDTNAVDRDVHLRSPDFFDVARYPVITFRSTKITPRGGNRYEIAGDLTMRNEAHRVTFEAEVEAPIKDPWGNRRIAGVASGTLQRKKWGLRWNQVLETGSLLVGEEVKFTIEVEVVEQAVATAA